MRELADTIVVDTVTVPPTRVAFPALLLLPVVNTEYPLSHPIEKLVGLVGLVDVPTCKPSTPTHYILLHNY